MPQPFECRWIVRSGPLGEAQRVLQQYLPHLKKCEWTDVPVVDSSQQTTTIHVSKQSGPQDVVTAPTKALEPLPGTFGSPEEIERAIEKQMLILTALMKLRTDMSGFPPYDGTLVLVHGSGKPRMFVNGFEREMAPKSQLIIISDEDVHNFQTHTVPRKGAGAIQP